MVLTFNRLLITLSCAFNLLNCGSCRLVVVNEMKLLQFGTSITGSNFKAISIFGENISLLCVFITLIVLLGFILCFSCDVIKVFLFCFRFWWWSEDHRGVPGKVLSLNVLWPGGVQGFCNDII